MEASYTNGKEKKEEKKAEAINGRPYASTINEPRRMRGRESGRAGLTRCKLTGGG